MQIETVSTTIDINAIERALKTKAFRPHRLFLSGHAQTIISFLYPRRARLEAEFAGDEERLFDVAANAKILAHCRWQTGERRSSPTLILVHGLEGSSNSIYMLGTAAKAFNAGFNVVRLNLRTCGDTEHLTETLYHSGLTEDVRRVIEELINRDGLEQIFLAGFSLGGNLCLKLAGESGANAPKQLRAVCAVSPSIDLAACADAIQRRSNWLYNRRFLNSLVNKMRRVQKLYPDIYGVQEIKRMRTIREFDDQFTARYGGFENADDYYARSSSLQFIKNIRIPTLMIHAEDDPFVPYAPFLDSSIKENPFVILLAPKHGGHVGFISDSKDEDPFWAENRIVEFCRITNAEARIK